MYDVSRSNAGSGAREDHGHLARHRAELQHHVQVADAEAAHVSRSNTVLGLPTMTDRRTLFAWRHGCGLPIDSAEAIVSNSSQFRRDTEVG